MILNAQIYIANIKALKHENEILLNNANTWEDRFIFQAVIDRCDSILNKVGK